MMSDVPMSDRDRKLLWGRGGNRCAICRRVLVAERTDSDPEAVVGDEARMAARSPGGRRYGECDRAQVDAYENRLLLCKVHHKIVDDHGHEVEPDRVVLVHGLRDGDLGAHPVGGGREYRLGVAAHLQREQPGEAADAAFSANGRSASTARSPASMSTPADA